MTIAILTLEGDSPQAVTGARSLMYRLLSTSFAFPGDDLCEALATGQWDRDVSGILERLPYKLSAYPIGPTDTGALRDAYVTTFEVGTGKPYCPLYEGSHRSGRMKLMEDLVRYYEYFGLKTTAGDHPDHVCAQLDFMHYLSFKEAAASSHGDLTTDVRRAQRDFLDRHLCRWLPRLRSRIEAGRDVPPFYGVVAALADDFCREERRCLPAGRGIPHEKVRKQPDNQGRALHG